MNADGNNTIHADPRTAVNEGDERGMDQPGASAGKSAGASGGSSGGGEDRVDELMQIIEAYNQVTERLQRSHDTLTEAVKRLQGQLASANAALQRSRRLAALGEMAAGIAHEVRNPLASIQLYAGMLQEDLAHQPEQRDLAERIVAAVRGLDGIVNDVLSFARETDVQPEPGAIETLLRKAVEAERPAVEAAGIEVRYALENDGLAIRHDPRLMHRALVNLIRNATQAMPEGGTLTLGATGDETAVQIVVADTGPGISDEAVDRIFNPFFTTRDTGTGLGLAIVHRIVDAHGGSIAVHNDPSPGGAVFTLSLPTEPPAPHDTAGGQDPAEDDEAGYTDPPAGGPASAEEQRGATGSLSAGARAAGSMHPSGAQ